MTGVPEVLVQKFGGSSVAVTQDLRRVVGIIKQACQSARSVVVVVSARGNTTNELIDLAAEVSAAPSPRELDQLLATGEVASAALLAIALEDLGIPAVSLDGRQAGISARGQHGQGVVTEINTGRVRELLAEGKVVVVAGFQGVNPAGDVVTLGRGGSDTSAVALTAALGQSQCHIYTDVDAVYSSDPRTVPSAHKLPAIPLTEVAELAFAGAKVLHHRAGGLAAANGIELRVSSSFRPGAGTTAGNQGQIRPESQVTAVALDTDAVKVSIGADLAACVLSVLARDCAAIDLFGWHQDRMVFTVRQEFMPSVRQVLQARRAEHADDLTTIEAVAKASAVGRGLLSSAEYLARVTNALRLAGVPADTVSAAQSRISAIVPIDCAATAVEALHAEFALGEATDP
jgi:aspartate kinase